MFSLVFLCFILTVYINLLLTFYLLSPYVYVLDVAQLQVSFSFLMQFFLLRHTHPHTSNSTSSNDLQQHFRSEFRSPSDTYQFICLAQTRHPVTSHILTFYSHRKYTIVTKHSTKHLCTVYHKQQNSLKLLNKTSDII